MRLAIALLGLMASVSVLVAANAPSQPSLPPVVATASFEPEPFRSNLDLLADVRTVVDKDDPLYRELAEDDARNGREIR